MWRRIEDLLDRIIPAVEVRDEIPCQVGKERFERIIKDMVSRDNFAVRTVNSRDYILKVSGRTIGELTQAKSLFMESEPKWYENMKSRLRVRLSEESNIELISYEHIIALARERAAFSTILERRLEEAKKFIEEKAVEPAD